MSTGERLRRAIADIKFLDIFDDVTVDDSGLVQSVLDTPDGRMIFLDTLEAGAHDGILCEQRLAWLRTRLDEARQQPVCLFLHHPPCNYWHAG